MVMLSKGISVYKPSLIVIIRDGTNTRRVSMALRLVMYLNILVLFLSSPLMQFIYSRRSMYMNLTSFAAPSDSET